ncbi:transcription factor ILR3 [Ziziphus jujuba]|uniref:Transcription factor ILR3 n=1 Tax=Ziziphus jujuba TaxID=326968 RepID=A0ABM3IF88_ZIZJJ|nr:transcription factor ILR3 [Ziziphus jujuba]
MDMASSETSNWLFDYGIMEDIAPPESEFSGPATGFGWPSQPINCSPDASVEVDYSSGDSDRVREIRSRKRQRSKSCSASCTKACREKLRRDRLNGRFLELVSVLDLGSLPKMDKGAILSDTVRILTQLRSESQRMKESIEDLQAKIKELKAEKNELRDEKQRLKAEKERLEHQVRAMSRQPGFLPHPPAVSSALNMQGPASGSKLMPFISYPCVTMWQMMPPSTVDTSQDHVLRPPVA